MMLAGDLSMAEPPQHGTPKSSPQTTSNSMQRAPIARLDTGMTTPGPSTPAAGTAQMESSTAVPESTPSLNIDPQSILGVNLAPRNSMLASQPSTDRNWHDASSTETSREFKMSTPESYRKASQTLLPSHHPPTISYPVAAETPSHAPFSMPKPMMQIPQQSPASSSADGKSSGKLTKQYMMSDGTVVSGRGLGRGRPGVKRGPRNQKSQDGSSIDVTPSPVDQLLEQPQAESQGAKRKRTDSEASNLRARSLSSSLKSRESSIEYNPTATHTRSGRQTQKPISIAATPSSTASPAIKRQSVAPSMATPALKAHPKIKRKVYRGREQFALCEHCLRGFGPSGNVIVFCDACNKCWHQRCHDPHISKEVVADTKAEWFCSSCDKILHGSKKSKKLSLPTKTSIDIVPPSSTPVVPIGPRFGPPLVGAASLTTEQRRAYLGMLSKDKLIELVLRAGNLSPQMPIFETPIPPPQPVVQQPQPQFASSYVTPVSELPPLVKSGSNDIPDEGYDDYFDEHAALYPKAGEGVKLPPESADISMLLEGPDSRTFSHWVRGTEMKTSI